MDRIPGQIGYLILNEEGAVVTSAGELENDENFAKGIIGLLTIAGHIDNTAFLEEDIFRKLTISYSKYYYVICISNRKVHIVKRQVETNTATA